MFYKLLGDTHAAGAVTLPVARHLRCEYEPYSLSPDNRVVTVTTRFLGLSLTALLFFLSLSPSLGVFLILFLSLSLCHIKLLPDPQHTGPLPQGRGEGRFLKIFFPITFLERNNFLSGKAVFLW